MKGQVLHRLRARLKVPGLSSDLSKLLTRKFPMFLSRLNETNEGCEKIHPVSLSFWSNLKFFKMIFLNISFGGMSAGSFSRTAAGNRAYLTKG